MVVDDLERLVVADFVAIIVLKLVLISNVPLVVCGVVCLSIFYNRWDWNGYYWYWCFWVRPIVSYYVISNECIDR